MVSSIPLPDLIPMIVGVPEDVVDAAAKLACSTCVLVNIAVDREDISNAHMSYFYDEDICFTRLSFPHMLSPNNAPKGTGSIQAEVYFSKKYRPLTVSGESLIDPVIADLKKVGLIRDSDKIIHRNAMVAALRERDLRSRARAGAGEGPRLPGRRRDLLLRPLRRLGVPVDR